MTITESPALAGLRRAVILDPADDTLRLLFADELDEQGQPEYAEFVRVQVELANPRYRGFEDLIGKLMVPYGFKRWEELRRSERLLTDRLNRDTRPNRLDSWAPDLWRMHSTTEYPVWRRGFVEELPTTVERWDKHGREILTRWPITRVILTTLRGMGRVSGEGRSWGRVTSYGMSSGMFQVPERLTGVTFTGWGLLKFDTVDIARPYDLSRWDGTYERMSHRTLISEDGDTVIRRFRNGQQAGTVLRTGNPSA